MIFCVLRTGYSISPFGDLTLLFIRFNRQCITYFFIHLWSNLCGCYDTFERNWSFIEFLRVYIHACLAYDHHDDHLKTYFGCCVRKFIKMEYRNLLNDL